MLADPPSAEDASALVAMDAEGRIAADLACVRCGYLLRKQRPYDHCPECGAAVGVSLNASNIRLFNPYWLRQIQIASIILAASIPLIFLFGLGVVSWLVGTFTLLIEYPAHLRSLRRMRVFASVTGILGVLNFAAALTIDDLNGTRPIALVVWFLFPVMIALHIGAVVRAGAVVATVADWKGLARFGGALAWSTWVWPWLFGAMTVLMGMAFGFAWGGNSAPPMWLNPLLAVLGFATLIVGLFAAFGQLIFWIVLAVRMQAVRTEARVIQQGR